MNQRYNRNVNGYAFLLPGQRFPGSDTATIHFNGELTGVQDIDDAWRLHRTSYAVDPDMSTLLSVVRACKIAIGNPGDWIRLNVVDNPALSDHAVDFLVDCIRYATTGKRHMSVAVWRELVVGSEVTKAAMANRSNALKELSELDIPSNTGELLVGWCRMSGGIDDLIHSSSILFGSSIN